MSNSLVSIIIIIIVVALSGFLGRLLNPYWWGRIISMTLFVVIISSGVYYCFRHFGSVKNINEHVIYQEEAASAFNWLAFLLVFVGCVYCGYLTFYFFKINYKTFGIFFALISLGGLLTLPNLTFNRKITLAFTDSGVLTTSSSLLAGEKSTLLNYKNIEKYILIGNTLVIYPRGQKIWGSDILATPVEININNIDRVKEILGSKISSQV